MLEWLRYDWEVKSINVPECVEISEMLLVNSELINITVGTVALQR